MSTAAPAQEQYYDRFVYFLVVMALAVVAGTLFGTGKYYVPEEEVRRVGEHRILLGTTRDDLRELDWFAPPAGMDSAPNG